MVYVIAEAVEIGILESEVSLAKVRNISHGKEKKKEESFAGYIKLPLPWKKFKGISASQLPTKENVNQLVLKLAENWRSRRD